MNRAQRRAMEKQYRKKGFSKQSARAYVEQNYKSEPMSAGQKCKLNYEFMIRHKQYKEQTDEFRAWVEEHKNDIFTVEIPQTENEDHPQQSAVNVNFVEDTTEPKWLLHVDTLIPIASAKVTLDDGTQEVIAMDGVTDVNDPTIMDRINSVLDKDNLEEVEVMEDNNE